MSPTDGFAVNHYCYSVERTISDHYVFQHHKKIFGIPYKIVIRGIGSFQAAVDDSLFLGGPRLRH